MENNNESDNLPIFTEDVIKQVQRASDRFVRDTINTTLNQLSVIDQQNIEPRVNGKDQLLWGGVPIVLVALIGTHDLFLRKFLYIKNPKILKSLTEVI
jgi:hypothetical protein